MVHILDAMLILLGIGLGVVGYIMLRESVLKERHAGRVHPFRQRRRLRLPSRSTISSVILLLVAALYFGKPYVPQIHSLFPQSSSGSCNIKGNINFSGERIFHVPGN